MTLPQKLLWFCLLLVCLGAGMKLNLPIQPAIVQPPNTNTYGCKLIWDAVPFAEQYRVYLGTSPSSLLNITNVSTTGAVFRVWATNDRPTAGVVAVVQGQESDMALLSWRQWFVGRVETLQGETAAGFEQETTNTGRQFIVRGGLSNNWLKSP